MAEDEKTPTNGHTEAPEPPKGPIGIPPDGVGNFVMAMSQIGLAVFGLCRAGGRLQVPQDPALQPLIAQLDQGMSVAAQALSGGARIVLPR